MTVIGVQQCPAITRCVPRDKEGLGSSWEVARLSASKLGSAGSAARYRPSCVTAGPLVGDKQ